MEYYFAKNIQFLGKRGKSQVDEKLPGKKTVIAIGIYSIYYDLCSQFTTTMYTYLYLYPPLQERWWLLLDLLRWESSSTKNEKSTRSGCLLIAPPCLDLYFLDYLDETNFVFMQGPLGVCRLGSALSTFSLVKEARRVHSSDLGLAASFSSCAFLLACAALFPTPPPSLQPVTLRETDFLTALSLTSVAFYCRKKSEREKKT